MCCSSQGSQKAGHGLATEQQQQTKTYSFWPVCLLEEASRLHSWDGWFSSPFCCSAAAKSLQTSLTLCDPIDGSPPGSPVPGILQARTLEWVAISFSNAWKWKVKVTLSDPMDCSPPGSPVPGILQARVLEWGAIAFSVPLFYLCPMSNPLEVAV